MTDLPKFKNVEPSLPGFVLADERLGQTKPFRKVGLAETGLGPHLPQEGLQSTFITKRIPHGHGETIAALDE
jgi:hypothetical protein